MGRVLEIVRSTIPPENEAEVLARRPAAMAAFQAAFPGLVAATLARLDDGSWIDVLTWRSQEDAAQAAAHFGEVPELASFMALIGQVQAFDQGTIEHELGGRRASRS
jgi:hypothetical protein